MSAGRALLLFVEIVHNLREGAHRKTNRDVVITVCGTNTILKIRRRSNT
jgi:hypothetical protein